MTIIEQIKAEIERRITDNTFGAKLELIDILAWLDTLESKKTISPWKKIHTYTEEIHEGDMEKMLLELSVGKGEKRTKTALPDRIVDILESEKPVPADLEEAALSRMRDPDMYLSDAVIDEIGDELLKMAQFGAKWQADHSPLPEDTVLFNKGVEEGKRLMMEEAVEGYVTLTLTGVLTVAATIKEGDNIGVGDKVRVIIVKED